MNERAPSSPNLAAASAVEPTDAPAIPLGPGFSAAPFAPGRYGVLVTRKLHGTHARQVVSETSAAQLLLDLSADGVATACRGWRYDAYNRGPQIQTEDRYREQQGYRGRYVVRDGVAEVTLAFDGEGCPARFEGPLALPRVSPLVLRCVSARAEGALAAVTPLLLCQPVDAAPRELEPLQVGAIAPSGWFAVAGGPGLLVQLTGLPPGARAGAEGKAEAALASSPLDASSWERPL